MAARVFGAWSGTPFIHVRLGHLRRSVSRGKRWAEEEGKRRCLRQRGLPCLPSTEARCSKNAGLRLIKATVSVAGCEKKGTGDLPISEGELRRRGNIRSKRLFEANSAGAVRSSAAKEMAPLAERRLELPRA